MKKYIEFWEYIFILAIPFFSFFIENNTFLTSLENASYEA